MSSPARRSPPEVGVDGNWACPKCDNVNFGIRTECNLCKTQPDGKWVCPGCKNVNFPHREECNRCKVSRPARTGNPSRGPGVATGMGMGMGGGMNRMGGDPRVALAMQLVGLFSGSPDPFTSAAQFVYALGASGAGYGALPAFGMGGGGFAAPAGQKRPRGAPQAGEGGNWACSCGNVNFAFRTSCNKCETPKPELA